MKFFLLFAFITCSFVGLSQEQSRQPLVEDSAFLSDEYDNGYPESKYHEVLDKFIEVYTPIIKAKGGSFHILRDFTDGAVNAWAWRIADEYHLEIPGGLSRYYLINEEAFIITICHELGHLLGGAPTNYNISYEGQSDYYATTHCAKLMLPKVSPYKELPLSDDVKKLCHLENDFNLCKRLLTGSQSISNYFAKLERNEFPTLLYESDIIVNQTLKKHPNSQCRLDTLKRGSLCHAKMEDISDEDYLSGYCKNHLARPKCWFVDQL